MSAQPHRCEACEIDGVLEGAEKFPESQESEATYGVGWRCPKCKELSLDLCPVGPVEPTKTSCLNCGGEPPPEESCPGCGMSRDEAKSFLHLREVGASSLEEAEIAFDKGLYRHAFAVLDSLLQIDPMNADIWSSKGTHYQILQLSHSAARCYRRSIEIEPKPLIQIALACALSETKDNPGAISIYDEIIENSQDEQAVAIAHANRGNLHEAASDVDAAIADYEAAIHGEPKRVSHYQNYLRVLARRKRWSDVPPLAKRGLTVIEGEERIPILIELARSYNERQLPDAALLVADEILERSPEHPRGLYQRGWSLGMLGRLDEARSALEKLLEVEPGSKDGARALAKIQAAHPSGTKKPWWKLWG